MKDQKGQGVDAVNQQFSRFEQVRKTQRYQLAEKPERDQFDDDYRIRTC